MTTHTTIRVVCEACEGKGERVDPDDPPHWGAYVCPLCMGHGFRGVNAPAPACDVIDHTESEPPTNG